MGWNQLWTLVLELGLGISCLTGTEFGYFLKRGMTTMIGTMIGTGMEYRIEL